MLIHPVVYVERRRQMRAKMQQAFSISKFDGFLERCGIAVIPLDHRNARSDAWTCPGGDGGGQEPDGWEVLGEVF